MIAIPRLAHDWSEVRYLKYMGLTGATGNVEVTLLNAVPAHEEWELVSLKLVLGTLSCDGAYLLWRHPTSVEGNYFWVGIPAACGSLALTYDWPTGYGPFDATHGALILLIIQTQSASQQIELWLGYRMRRTE